MKNARVYVKADFTQRVTPPLYRAFDRLFIGILDILESGFVLVICDGWSCAHCRSTDFWESPFRFARLRTNTKRLLDGARRCLE
eukprot:scaffold813_cov59-Cyclotella_meneghiniana.AAC.2